MSEDDTLEPEEMEDFLACKIGAQFILRGRVDPLFCVLTVNIHPHYAEHNTIHDLMELAEAMLLEEIDTKGQHRLVFADERHNRHVIIVDEVQAVSLLAPDEMPKPE